MSYGNGTLTLEDPAHIKIGTCAWSYEDWRGTFYPEHLPAGDRLAYYARQFPAVEVDSTFYHIPTPQVVAHWAEVTPPNFAFACKLPREITHERKLRESAEPLHDFLSALQPLGEKLWCVVVQLPPFFQLARDEAALKHFVQTLPESTRFAIEFRHQSWHQPRIAQFLQAHRVAWVWSDDTPLDHQSEGAFEMQPDATDFAYVRLMGDLERKYGPDGHRLHHYREVQWPRDASLDHWATRIRLTAADHCRVFVAVSNHFEGFAPESVRRLGTHLGFSFPRPAEPLHRTDEQDERQLDLL